MIDNHVNNPKSIKHYVRKFLFSIASEIKNKIVIDIPAGSGSTSEILLELGANVKAFDLFPEYFMVNAINCERANISSKIPLDDGYADWLICQEGLEHFSDQLNAFKEFNRVLKNDGKLLITTPSYSNLAAKLSYLLFESEISKNMPPNELCDVWMSNTDLTTDLYYGHVFMIGLQKMRTLAKLSGFKIKEIKYVRLSKGSLLLFPLFYPFILINSYCCYVRNLKRYNNIALANKKQVFAEQLKINIHPKNLLNKHSFIIFEKECAVDDVAANFNAVANNLYSFDKVM